MRKPTALAAWAVLAGASLAQAWPADVAPALNRDARRLLPRSLAQLLAERQAAILDTSGRLPLPLTNALAADRASGNLRDETLGLVGAEIDRAVQLLKSGQIDPGLVAMGGLFRVGADLSDAALAGSSPQPQGVVPEYYAFLRAQLPNLPVVLDNRQVLTGQRKDLYAYWRDVLSRSTIQAPVLGTEFFRRGRLVSHETLDARSHAFGVAQLSYSRAITSIAATWLVAWREAHGDLTRMGTVTIVRPMGVPSPQAEPPSPNP
jgi:hypothetical protein